MNKTKLGLVFSGVILGITFVLVGWRARSQSYTFQGSLIDPPVAAADFQLVDQNARPFRLSEQRGRILLMLFGYTHCPDVCPLTLSQFKQIKGLLGDEGKDVGYILITVDPERDTPQQLNQYLANFDASFVGLTGSHSDLDAVWKSYGVYQEQHAADSHGNYETDHTARIYLIDAKGNWRVTYSFGMENEKIAQDVAHLLSEE